MSRFAPEVIVVGAGPAGLLAALRLARAELRVLVLEKRAELDTASRDMTLHPPALEVLDTVDVLDVVLPTGQHVDTMQYRTPRGVVAEFHMRDLAGETRFPYCLHVERSRVVPPMVERVRAFPNARVAFARGVLGLTQDEAGVSVALEGGTTVGAQYVLAADGASSTVRDALGIGFPGEGDRDRVLRLSTTDDLGAMLPGIAPVTSLSNGAHAIGFLRMPDCWRIHLRVPAGTAEAQATDPGWILSRFQAVLPGLPRLPRLAGVEVYAAGCRVAERFHAGRVALVGSAAHVSGQWGGMNTSCGIQDADALAEAIADGRGVAEAAEQRRRVAVELLLPCAGRAEAEALREKARSPADSRAFLRAAAMLDMPHAASSGGTPRGTTRPPAPRP